MGAAKVGAERGAGVIGSFAKNATAAAGLGVDLLLPGTLGSDGIAAANKFMYENSPTGAAAHRQQQAAAAASRFGGHQSPTDVPQVTANFNISGVNDPEEVARVVNEKLSFMVRNALINSPTTQ
jgi:hypothetical protein